MAFQKRKFKYGTEGFTNQARQLVRVRPSQVAQFRKKVGGNAIMSRGEAANRLHAFRKTDGRKAALGIKRASRKSTGY